MGCNREIRPICRESFPLLGGLSAAQDRVVRRALTLHVPGGTQTAPYQSGESDEQALQHPVALSAGR